MLNVEISSKPNHIVYCTQMTYRMTWQDDTFTDVYISTIGVDSVSH